MEIFDLEPVMVRGVLGKDRVGIANRLLGDRRRRDFFAKGVARRFFKSLHAE